MGGCVHSLALLLVWCSDFRRCENKGKFIHVLSPGLDCPLGCCVSDWCYAVAVLAFHLVLACVRRLVV